MGIVGKYGWWGALSGWLVATHLLVSLFENLSAVDHVVDRRQVRQDGRGGSAEGGDAVKLPETRSIRRAFSNATRSAHRVCSPPKEVYSREDS